MGFFREFREDDHDIEQLRGSRVRLVAVNAEFVTFVKDQLADLGPLENGHFFGGHAFKYEGKQFAMILFNTLFFKVDDRNRPDYTDLGMDPFTYKTKKGLVTSNKYFEVPEDVLEDPSELCEWAHRAMDAALKS
jgi:DNA transformation protein